MKLYITKPKHTKYGRIPLENPFNSIEELIENCQVWLHKPFFEKPFMDIFGEGFCWRFWNSDYHCSVFFNQFPEGEVKECIRQTINDSISANFHENRLNSHYKWIGEINVELFRKETPSNFNLYLTKPSSIWDIRYAGIDRCRIFLSKPNIPLDLEKHYINYISGKFFRKNKEFEDFCLEMWSDIKNSFDVEDNIEFNFLEKISETNHKNNQDCANFIKEYFFDINIKK